MNAYVARFIPSIDDNDQAKGGKINKIKSMRSGAIII